MKALLKVVKRNPVILGALAMILSEATKQAIDSGHFTFEIWCGYVGQLALAFVVRQWTVPLKDHENLAAQVNQAKTAQVDGRNK